MKDIKQRIRFCATGDGVRIACATLGRGLPLVRVATYMTHLEYDHKSPVWVHWLRDLSKHFTLIRYDQRGCGLSDREVEEFSVNAWVGDLETVVDSLGLERFALLGPSQGGAIAIAYAIRHPHRVSHLLLYGAYIRGRFHRKPAPQQLDEAHALLKLMKVGWGKDNPAFRQVFSNLFMPEGTPEQIHWFNDLQRISTSPENAARIEETVYNIDISDLAPKVSVPTLVLHARDDAMIPFEEGRKLAAMIPNAHFAPLESKNHLLLESEPAWQHFLNEVVNFVSIEQTEPLSPKPTSPPLDSIDDLTRREREILDLIARGLDNNQIAEHLFISSKTVRNHITNIYSKLKVSTRAQAILKALEAGLGRNKV